MQNYKILIFTGYIFRKSGLIVWPPSPTLPPSGGREMNCDFPFSNYKCMVKLKGREEYPIYYGAKPELLGIAYDLRRTMTEAERALWEKLRNRQVKGYRFRRQHPISEFVVDFFCYEAKLIIELDGEVHNDPFQRERDNERTKMLKSMGLDEIRFRNEEVLTNLEEVVSKILKNLP
jgi:very-short-patch-repair endonuclease